MERSSKRGKIPQGDWPSIIARYEAGETLASIARTYDCSPPAISYILSRSRARASVAALAATSSAGNPAVAPPHGGGSLFDGAAPSTPAIAAEPLPGNGAPASQPAGQARGLTVDRGLEAAAPDMAARGSQEETRRTLHLSHGQANGSERSNGGAFGPLSGGPLARGGPSATGLGPVVGPRPPARPPVAEPPPPRPPAGPAYAAGNGAALRVLAEPQQSPRENGGALDQALRERVHADLTAFLAAFDAALADDTPESRTGLREATDRLLRVGARTRIELERLEARLPLPGRVAPPSMPYWRQR